MALYGNNFYNLFKYGPDTLVDFDATPFTATATDYAALSLSWQSPSGDWDVLHLVRNTLGFPVTPDDGELLLETVPETAVNSYLDRRTNPNTGEVLDPKIVEGKTYYYGVFVRNASDGQWYSAGVTLGTAVKNYGTADMMYSYLPFMYKSLSINGLASDTSGLNTDLFNFLRLFAFEYDKFKTDAENVKRRYDVANLNGKLIPLMMNQFGFIYEKEMGIQQGRRLLQNAINIYSKKGSAAGLKNFVSAFSGYNVTLGPAKNLLLTINDSSFELSLGSWELAGSGPATISQISGLLESPAISPYLEPTSPSNYPNATSGVMKAVANDNTTVSFACGAQAPKTSGVPVVAGSDYTFSIYTMAATTARDIYINIYWYDRDGVYLSSGTASTSTNLTTGWSRATAITATAPDGAYFAAPAVSILGCSNGEVHYLDAAQFEKSSTATDYVDARRVDIYLDANRVNEIKNPSFETNLDHWVTFSSTKSRVTAGPLSSGAVTGSDAWMDVKASLNNITVRPNGFVGTPILPNTPYTFSVYLKSDKVGDNANLRMDWWSSELGASQGTSIQPTFTTLDSQWKRVEYTVVSPAHADDVTLSIDIYSATGDSTFSVDAAMLEAASYAQGYFDGSTGYYETGDILWEDGNDVDGRSLYYRNRLNVTKRLSAVVPDYLPHGAQWALFAGVSHA